MPHNLTKILPMITVTGSNANELREYLASPRRIIWLSRQLTLLF